MSLDVIAYVLTAISTLLLALGATIWTKNEKWAALVLSFGGISVLVAAVFYWQASAKEEASKPKVVVVLFQSIASLGPALDSRWWAVYPADPRRGPQKRCPITHLLFIALKNETSVPLKLSSFSIEGRQAGDDWKKFTRVAASDNVSYCYVQTSLKEARAVNLGETFQMQVMDKSVSPAATCEGWIPLEAPEDLVATGTLRWRFKGIDMAGDKFSAEIKQSEGEGYEDVQSAQMSFQGFIDVSAVPPILYSQAHWR